METKLCLDCELRIIGRADKKFCSDACRNNYNNKLNSDTNAFMRNVNNLLRKNRRILQELIDTKQKKRNALANKLISQGFNFDYYTHVLNTKTGNTYFFCYEYGYRKLENNHYLLVKKQSD